jgi:hypothetical protein
MHLQLQVLDEGDGATASSADETFADLEEEEQPQEAPPSASVAPSSSAGSLTDLAKSPSIEDLAKKKSQARLSGSGLRAPNVGKSKI